MILCLLVHPGVYEDPKDRGETTTAQTKNFFY